ncbi:methyltransferase N6AMT1 isoform X2 [Elgaria multicarinata webbii]|uniref:methyltransferase N6AMT1 isoform X2 n=1 Tax=Elgaria multicarinata webbii TaxID=159646 RepID=UPI002FCD449A
MIPTPWHQHVGPQGPFGEVYEPSEDTFLLLDALEGDAEELRSAGCTDINPVASLCTAETAIRNNVDVQPIVTDLVTGLLPRLHGKVDVLLFNPPYVVTPSVEIQSHGIEAAWAGGKNGREVMDRLIPLVSDLLSAKGLFYLVTIKENNSDEIIETLQKCGLQGTRALSRQAGRENLSILKFQKS